MLMTADSLRKTQYEGTIIFLSFFLSLCERRSAGVTPGKSAQKQKRGEGCEEKKRKEKGAEETGDHPVAADFHTR